MEVKSGLRRAKTNVRMQEAAQMVVQGKWKTSQMIQDDSSPRIRMSLC